MLFYDTCALLSKQKQAFNGKKFYISSFTLKELENIKTAGNKDPEVKFKARRLINLLDKNSNDYEVIIYDNSLDKLLSNYGFLSDNNDSRIILSALELSKDKDITFVTDDICCKQLAATAGLNVQYLGEEVSRYTGFTEIKMNQDALTDFYTKLYKNDNFLKLNINEYLIIKDEENKVIDQYKWTDSGLKEVPYHVFESKMFGKVKPKDIYQQIAMDSMKKNKLTMVRGSAGTGKSYLSFAYLFECLEKGTIDKIIIFCNTVATQGSAKLGFYPGTRDEKLIDSQIGNLLASKLGDKMMVEDMISKGTLVLLPLSDIRGFDTTGMKAGIYITEAQNMDIELMRLSLQRIGEDSICILDGDSETQVDLPQYAGNNNGMRRVSQIFRGDPVYGEVTLQYIHRSRIARLAEKL